MQIGITELVSREIQRYKQLGRIRSLDTQWKLGQLSTGYICCGQWAEVKLWSFDREMVQSDVKKKKKKASKQKKPKNNSITSESKTPII